MPENQSRISRLVGYAVSALRREKWRGYCVVCERRTLFVNLSEWEREHCRCLRCRSSARGRALVQVLNECAPGWPEADPLEIAPYGAVSRKLETACSHYTGSIFSPGATPGSERNGYRCEDLRSLSFENESLDIIVSQDVLEHVIGPAPAFSEIARVLRPGGIHVFTVPLHGTNPSLTRVALSEGREVHLEEPMYHREPGSNEGSLVATDWGEDITTYIEEHSGMSTEILSMDDPGLGLTGGHLQVLVSRKAPSVIDQINRS